MAWLLVLLALLWAPLASAQDLTPAPATAPAAAPDARQLQREHILDTARRYAEFEWQGHERNVLHGPDGDGTQVDTPDVSFDAHGWRTDGGVQRGMPYAWGGFSSIEEFRAGLVQGLPAGNVPKSERAQASASALGLDCSGYVARCWELPVKQSTRSLGALCYPLPDYDALQPADILNLFDGHVVIFERWLDAERTRMSVYEAGRLGVVVSEYTVATLKRLGFQPMRYKPLDDRWLPMVLGKPSFSARPAESAGSAADVMSAAPSVPATSRGHWVAEQSLHDAAPLELATLESPLRDARPREWVRYTVTGGEGPDASACERLSMIAVAQDPHVEIQTETILADGTIPRGTQLEHADVLLDALLDFSASDEALRAIEVGECAITRGNYELAGRRFPSFRIQAQLRATRVMRHQSFPATLAIDCVISPQVPVHGVLEAQVVEETVWRAEPPEQRSVSRWVSRSELLEFGGGE